MSPRVEVSVASFWFGGLGALLIAACSGGGGDPPAITDAAVVTDPDAAIQPDAPTPIDAAIPTDAAIQPDAPTPIDAAIPIDAAVPLDAPAESWATYHIAVGAHNATITGGGNGNPVQLITNVDGRDFRFAFNGSAVYVITNPVEPQDQFDWNKLPGLSDCGQFDLSVNGAMFGWRWRLDLTPHVLEVTAYANNNSSHLTPAQPLFTLDAGELAADAPLRYRVWWSGAMYHFTVSGMIGARAIDVSATLPRVCPNQAAGAIKWAGQFYFGGTSTAPSVITSRIHEIQFAP